MNGQMEVPMAGGLAAKRGGGLPKLRELLRRQRRDSDVSTKFNIDLGLFGLGLGLGPKVS